mgnify:FL=1
MTLKYRGTEYSTDKRDGLVNPQTLTYRGKQYTRQSGSCRKVTFHEVYRGIKHDEQRLVCA